MSKILLSVLVVVIIGGIGLFAFSSQKKANPSSSSAPSPSFPQRISPTNTSPIDLGAGGNSYLDEKGVFSILYPNDYVLDSQDPQHIRIYKRGVTQRPQSEMSDGVLIVFESVDLQGISLEAWVDTRIKESTADGTSEIIKAKKPVVYNTYPGFHYVLRGLGTSQQIALQKDVHSKNAMLITYSVSDPEHKGYQKEVEGVLSALKLLK
jgi:hypothetical protein